MTGEITSTATYYATMVLLEAALDADNTGAATAGADTKTFQIVPHQDGGFYLVTIARTA